MAAATDRFTWARKAGSGLTTPLQPDDYLKLKPDQPDQPNPPTPPRDEAPLSGRRRTDAERPGRRQETGGWSSRATA